MRNKAPDFKTVRAGADAVLEIMSGRRLREILTEIYTTAGDAVEDVIDTVEVKLGDDVIRSFTMEQWKYLCAERGSSFGIKNTGTAEEGNAGYRAYVPIRFAEPDRKMLAVAYDLALPIGSKKLTVTFKVKDAGDGQPGNNPTMAGLAISADIDDDLVLSANGKPAEASQVVKIIPSNLGVSGTTPDETISISGGDRMLALHFFDAYISRVEIRAGNSNGPVLFDRTAAKNREEMKDAEMVPDITQCFAVHMDLRDNLRDGWDASVSPLYVKLTLSDGTARDIPYLKTVLSTV